MRQSWSWAAAAYAFSKFLQLVPVGEKFNESDKVKELP
jgi:hypothetical protein